MDFKSWLRRLPEDPSPMGRLISHAACCNDPEEFLVSMSKGTDPTFGREYRALAQGLIGQFKREGGKFKQPARFARVVAGPDIGGDVIAFRPRAGAQPEHSGDIFWTRFYAALLGIDIEEPAVEVETDKGVGAVEIHVFAPTRRKRVRKYG